MSLAVSQFVRLLAILAVLIIHGTYGAQVAFMHPENASWIDLAGVVLNQLSRFSVPIFVFLSGYGLAIKFRPGQAILPFAKDFYGNRMTRIGIPFLAWTLGNLLLSKRMQIDYSSGFFANVGHNALVFIDSIWQYGADYHLYFFTIILWCYLFFPLLVHTRSRLLATVLLVVLLAYQMPADEFLQPAGLFTPSVPSSFFFHWLFYFYLGILLARKDADQAPAQRPATLTWIAVLLFIVSFVPVFAEYLYRNNGQDTGNFDHFHRWTIFLYTMAAIFLFRSSNRPLSAYFENHPRLKSWVGYLAGISFCVYLIHTWILRTLDLFTQWFPLKLLLLIPIAFGAAFLLDTLLKKRDIGPVRILRLVLGLPA